jgi:hypothetical protein
LRAVAKAIDAQNKGKTAFKSVRNPEPFLIPGLPACETGYYIKQPCYDFVYAPDNLSSVNSIVQSMRAQNPGRTIPPEKVRFLTDFTRPAVTCNGGLVVNHAQFMDSFVRCEWPAFFV